MVEKRLGTGRIAFLARVEIFREKISAGHTMAMVYDEYQKELGISYSQFVNYVNRYIRKKEEEKKSVEEAPSNPKPKPKEKDGFAIPKLDNKDIY